MLVIWRRKVRVRGWKKDMKNKIKASLQQAYKNLGLGEEVFERVAEVGETFVKEEAQIANFTEGAKGLLTLYQSSADKVRGELTARIKELEEKAGGDGTNRDEGDEKGEKGAPDDIGAMIQAAVEAAVKPLSEELAGFRSEQSRKGAEARARASYESNAYVKKYPDEAEEAWERVMELRVYNSEWTEEEMVEKALGYFGKTVKRRGEDISKPLGNDGGGDETVADFSGELELLKEAGVEIE